MTEQIMNNGNAKIERKFNGITIVIPSKKNWFVLLFGTAWIGAWYSGFSFASSIVFSGVENGAPLGFLSFWLLAWTIGGLAVITFLLWGYFGQEKFLADGKNVFFEKTVFGIGKKNKLDRGMIKNFRSESVKNSWLGDGRLAALGLGPGKIKFDYGLKTYSFGLGVDDAEANYIVELLKEQFKEGQATPNDYITPIQTNLHYYK